jgi:hypothetical protein
VLSGGGHAGVLLGGDERPAAGGHHLRVAAVGTLVLVDEVAGLVEHIEDRRQVDVHAHAGEVLPGSGPGLGRCRGRVAGLADLLFRQDRRARQPPDLPAFLVGHQQQRRRYRALPLRLTQLPDDGRYLGGTGDVVAVEDHSGGLARGDQRQQRRRHGQAGIGEDHPLAGHLPGR